MLCISANKRFFIIVSPCIFQARLYSFSSSGTLITAPTMPPYFATGFGAADLIETGDFLGAANTFTVLLAGDAFGLLGEVEAGEGLGVGFATLAVSLADAFSTAAFFVAVNTAYSSLPSDAARRARMAVTPARR